MVARKTIWQLPKITHKFIKVEMTLSFIGRTKLLFLFMQLNFHNTLQCWKISLAYDQESRTELAFTEFPKDRAKKGLDLRC